MKTTLSIVFAVLICATFAFADLTNQTNGIDKRVVKDISTNSPAITDEQRLLKTIPELLWNQDYFVSNGWLKPEQAANPKATNFSKRDFTRFGVNGEISFLFLGQRLAECTFYINDGATGTTEGSEDWAKLYKAVRTICSSLEKRDGNVKSSSVSWAILGGTNQYDVKLTRRVFGTTVERGLEISIRPIKK